MNVTKIPPKEIWANYEPATAFRMIDRYHARLAERNRWQVFQWRGDTHYVDGATLTEIVDHYGHNLREVNDCDWTGSEWKERPWTYFPTPNGDILAQYRSKRSDPPARGYNANEVGHKRLSNDKWLWRRYDGGWGKPKADFLTGWVGETSWSIYDKGVLTRYNADKNRLTQGIFSHQIEVKRAETDYIIPTLRSLAHKENEGFYDELIDWIAETADISLGRYM